MNLWLDDERKAPSFAECEMHWEVAKTADEAIAILKTGNVLFASLDHDLADEHYQAYFKAMQEGAADVDTSGCKEKTGLTVLDWMEENGVWPEDGVRIHTMNTVRKTIMIRIVERQYGRNFQFQIPGTHRV